MKLTQRLPTLPKPTLFSSWAALLSLLITGGLIAGIIVFARGLSVTNLTDLVPWGLWIVIDLSAIALGAGAFMLSAAVYLLKLKHFEPLAKTAVFIGLIAYSMAMMMLLLDIGRPDRFWHGFVFWNLHSPLWEVTMCVGLYFTVLTLEVIPIFGRAHWMQARFPRLSKHMANVHQIAPVLAIAGLGLSLLHQSSLGATYGILQARPIWYKPGLAALAIISAMAAGPSMTILASTIAARVRNRENIHEPLFNQLSHFIGWVLVAYLYLRFWDMLGMAYTHEPGRTEGLQMLMSGSLSFNFWVGEILLGAIVPAFILLNGRLRKDELWRTAALGLVVCGLVAYRWDTNMVGQFIVFSYFPQDDVVRYTHYTPAFIEIAAGAGVVAYGLLAFTLGARYLRIVEYGQARLPKKSRRPIPVLSSGD